LGVCFDKRVSKWKAQIVLNGKNKHLGHFDTAELAADRYMTAKAEMHTFVGSSPSINALEKEAL
jgi:hypothetical protein